MNLLKDSGEKLGTFIKDIVEIKSEEQEVFLLIDEYDKPVGDCLKDNKGEKKAEAILENLKNNIYTFLKGIPATTILTGVHKLSMTSFFSEFNNLKDYSYLVNIGFTEKEVKGMFSILNLEYSDEIKRWYNGYNYEAGLEFNPWSVISYLEKQKIDAYWSKTGTSPKYFRYLINDILKVRNFEEFLDLIKEEKYKGAVVNLEYINEKNKNLILHYLHYAGLLTVTKEEKFAIPNNDVLYSYENLLFLPVETDLYYNLRDKSSSALLKLKETVEPLKDFIKFLLKEKYVNHDKRDLGKIGEQIITSDVALFYKTFARIDLRREVNILEGRTDLEYYDEFDEKILFEFKVIRKSSELIKEREEAVEQINRYNKLSKYNRSYIILVDLSILEVEVEEIKV
ncbi:MAG: AAA family ATPase [Candidatus Gracilibacteria bacterium]|nr:AAA family ATPase [Candidatus Gracilibacteria bacterium]